MLQNPAASSGQDGQDDGQAQTTPGELPPIPNADHEPESEPEPDYGAYLEADVMNFSPISSNYTDICIGRRRFHAWQR